MSFKISEPESAVFTPKKYVDEAGNTECAVFIRKAAKAPLVSLWRKGKKVLDAKFGEIPRGTAIATFDDFGKYPTDSKGKHAAIYLSHNPETKTIDVLDQWNGLGKVDKRTIRFWKNKNEMVNGRPYRRSNDSDTFYVIE
ncbi:MAG: uncharacterized protein JWQ40_1432 [Segetibacter sp.]|nr:uncharacterized protein [Segetibacter sp.]